MAAQKEGPAQLECGVNSRHSDHFLLTYEAFSSGSTKCTTRDFDFVLNDDMTSYTGRFTAKTDNGHSFYHETLPIPSATVSKLEIMKKRTKEEYDKDEDELYVKVVLRKAVGTEDIKKYFIPPSTV